jgi:hypothetical protein
MSLVLLQSLRLVGESGRLVRNVVSDRSSGEHCVPALRSACSGNAQLTQVELPFANSMDQLDSADGDRGVLERLDSQHRLVGDLMLR